jgi:hypothetical protein
MEGLARGVISGIYSPDEARASEDLPAVEGGHGAMPRVQQQVVPLSYGTDMKPPEPSAPKEALPPPAPVEPTQDKVIDLWTVRSRAKERLDARFPRAS